MRAHRTIWYITAAAIAAAAVILFMRKTADAPTEKPLDRQLVETMIDALRQDPHFTLKRTRALVAQVAHSGDQHRVDSPEIWFARGLQRRLERDYAGAESACREAIGLRPRWSWPYPQVMQRDLPLRPAAVQVPCPAGGGQRH